MSSLRLVAELAQRNGNPRYARATEIARGRSMVSNGLLKISTYDTPAAAIAFLEQQLAEFRARLPQPKEQKR